MFKRISHMADVIVEDEILFSTPFSYLFIEAARSSSHLLPRSFDTIQGLKALGHAMADPGTPEAPKASDFDSEIPSFFTYFGQFIDHDLTARTDRETPSATIGRAEPIEPMDPDVVVGRLRNGRRPQLDLDSVYGDGPALRGQLAVPPDGQVAPRSVSDALYDGFLFRINEEVGGNGLDVPREPDKTAIIADGRNDENLVISQIQAVFLQLHNAVAGKLQTGSAELDHIRARQLVRWMYQYVVINQYLMTVCDPGVVLDTLTNGPRFIGGTAGRGNGFMPLEFSAAAFRFGHSMIRPFYRVNGQNKSVKIMDLLAHKDHVIEGVDAEKEEDRRDAHLDPAFQLAWGNFLGTTATNHARKIDPLIANGLFDLPFEGRQTDPVLRHLAISNLLRGYNLSLPTGQAACEGFGIAPLSRDQILGELPADESKRTELQKVLTTFYFDQRTPLWFYVLREAQAQHGGQRLGELGSRIVCETIIGLVKQDPNSYLNNPADPAVKDALFMPEPLDYPGEPPKRGIRIVQNAPGAQGDHTVGSFEDMLKVIHLDPAMT